MWYFSWVLALGFVSSFAVLNAMWFESKNEQDNKKDNKKD